MTKKETQRNPSHNCLPASQQVSMISCNCYYLTKCKQKIVYNNDFEEKGRPEIFRNEVQSLIS